MRRNYDIFEKFPDGSTLWRACVSGRYEAHRKMQALAEHSDNDFYTIDIQAHQRLPGNFPQFASRMAPKNFRSRADVNAA